MTQAVQLDSYTQSAQNSATHTFSVGAGTNRILLVFVITEVTAGSAVSLTASYGGQSMTQFIAFSDTIIPNRQHTHAFYLNEAGIQAASNTTITITGGVANWSIFAVSYQHAQQSVITGVDTDQTDVSTNPWTSLSVVGSIHSLLFVACHDGDSLNAFTFSNVTGLTEIVDVATSGSHARFGWATAAITTYATLNPHVQTTAGTAPYLWRTNYHAFEIGGVQTPISRAAAIPTPTVLEKQTVTPASVACATTIPLPDLGGARPDPVPTPAAVPAPTLSYGSTYQYATVAATASIPTPIIGGGTGIVVSTLSAPAAVPAPGVRGGLPHAAVPVAITAAVPTATVVGVQRVYAVTVTLMVGISVSRAGPVSPPVPFELASSLRSEYELRI